MRDRIDAVETVAEDLFEEWSQELQLYNDPRLRSQSAGKLDTTRQRYERLISVMRGAAQAQRPVLLKLHDQVLYMKHNLNASALESLKHEVPALEREVARVIADASEAIREDERFLSTLP